MIRRLILLVVLAFSGGIGRAPADDSPNSEKRVALGSAAEARKAFRAEFGAFLKKSLSEEAQGYWQRRLADLDNERKWSVQRQPFPEAWMRVDDTLTEKERKSQILYGTLDGLRAARGDCWAVEYLAGFDGVIGYLDARTGRLVFLWRPPCG